jgi:glycosyltransferase involved in cell wall biosynthesis
LAIGGGKGWENSDINGQLNQLGISDRVKFLGYVADEDLPALFARCEAYVLPSLSEGFGITVLEAMMSGAPVVSSNAGALPEVGGDAVIYFDPINIDEMAAAIEKRLTCKDTRDAVVWRGLEQAGKFAWSKTAAQTLKAVESTAR